jgi:hypothetical protein
MKFRYLLLALLALIFVSPNVSFSQEGQGEISDPLTPAQKRTKYYLGPVAGYNRSLHSVELASFVDDPLCPFFSNGFANGYYAGISFEYPLGNPKDSRSSIIARVVYNTLGASFEKEGDLYPSLVDDPNNPGKFTTVLSKTRHSIDIKYNAVTFEAAYKFNLIGTFGLTVGPCFDFAIKKNMEQLYQIVEPLNVQFQRSPDAVAKGYVYRDNDRTIVVFPNNTQADGTIPGASSLRVGIKFGVQYEILLGRMYIVPVAYYNWGLTKLTPNFNGWYVNAIQMGVDVRFSI